MIGLIDSDSALPGYEFLYLGVGDECNKCSLKIPCHHNLEKDRRYLVKSLKDKTHKCQIFGKVRVCEIEEVGIEVALEEGSAFEGANIIFKPITCKNLLCPMSDKCFPEGLKNEDRCIVMSVNKAISCPEERDLILAVIQRI